MSAGLVFFFAFAFPSTVQAQPQLRNATSFDTGDSLYFWSARIGARLFRDSVQSDTTTGYHVMSSTIYMPDLVGDSLIKSLRYVPNDTNPIFHDSAMMYLFDRLSFRFTIYDSSTAGLDYFTVDTLGNGMQRIAPGYKTSVRLGCMYDTYYGIQVDSNDDFLSRDALQAIIDNFIATRRLPDSLFYRLNKMFIESDWRIRTEAPIVDTLAVLQQRLARYTMGSQSLFYTMRVTEENALFFINFAIVARSYNHDTWQAGEFLVRVVSRDSTGEWANEPINDNLWYKVSAPRNVTNLGEDSPWKPGYYDGGWPDMYVYKPWSKCAVNLSDFIGQDVRVEFYSSNCVYGVDPLYTYFAGDYTTPVLISSGCTGGTSIFIDSLVAPAGLSGYEWFASLDGPQDNLFDVEHMDTIHWRRLTGYLRSNIYGPTITDFVLAGENNQMDTLSQQTFMCIMYSALDPAKPVASKLYVNVYNHKPTPMCEVHDSCDLSITFVGTSTAPVGDEIDTAASYFVVFNDFYGHEPIDTLYGNTVRYVFPEARPFLIEQQALVVPFDSNGTTCSGGRRFFVTPRGSTPVPVILSDHSLCYGSPLHARAQFDSAARQERADGTLRMEWSVNGQPPTALNSEQVNMVGDSILSLFLLPEGAHAVCITSTNRRGCVHRECDTVHVYKNPRILIDPPSGVVCIGDSLTLEAFRDDRQIDTAYFLWSAEPSDTLLDAQQGSPVLHLQPTVDTRYTLHTSPLSICQLEDITVLITISEYPQAQLAVSPNPLDLDHPVVNLTDLTEGATHNMWYLSDGTQLSGMHLSHSFVSVPSEGVSITLHTCNYADCCVDTTVQLSVDAVTLWIPNVFIPGDERNGIFSISTNQQLLEFELYLYDRRGRLVYTSDDPQFEWDGTDMQGHPLPQGAYVYVFSYRLASSDTYRYPVKGTVTLLR